MSGDGLKPILKSGTRGNLIPEKSGAGSGAALFVF